jgi:hypothetical protein
MKGGDAYKPLFLSIHSALLRMGHLQQQLERDAGRFIFLASNVGAGKWLELEYLLSVVLIWVFVVAVHFLFALLNVSHVVLDEHL